MIPFCVPEDHHVLNLNTVTRIVEHEPLASAAEVNSKGGMWIEVYLADGQRLEFFGEPAKVILGQATAYFTWCQGMLAAAVTPQSQIVVPSTSH